MKNLAKIIFLASFSQFAFSAHVIHGSGPSNELELGETITYLDESTDTYTTITYVGSGRYLIEEEKEGNLHFKNEKLTVSCLEGDDDPRLFEPSKNEKITVSCLEDADPKYLEPTRLVSDVVEEGEESLINQNPCPSANSFGEARRGASTEEKNTNILVEKIKKGKVSAVEMNAYLPPKGNMK